MISIKKGVRGVGGRGGESRLQSNTEFPQSRYKQYNAGGKYKDIEE
jgi:hypothetical protein